MIPAPDDLIEDWTRACTEESPAWGYEGEGEQCQRPPGHDGPHYATGNNYESGGRVTIQWEVLP